MDILTSNLLEKIWKLSNFIFKNSFGGLKVLLRVKNIEIDTLTSNLLEVTFENTLWENVLATTKPYQMSSLGKIVWGKLLV